MHIVKYGGGVNSTAMLILMLKKDIPIDVILFCDTGGEKPQTYEFLPIFDQWLRRKYGKGITIIRRDPGLYDLCLEKGILPSRRLRWCTFKYKIDTTNEYIRRLGLPWIDMYIGFDGGEEGRVERVAGLDQFRSKENYEIFVKMHYPLNLCDISREKCMRIIDKEGLPVPVKSGCFFCPFRGAEDFISMKRDEPELFQKCVELEKRNRKGQTIVDGMRLENIET